MAVGSFQNQDRGCSHAAASLEQAGQLEEAASSNLDQIQGLSRYGESGRHLQGRRIRDRAEFGIGGVDDSWGW